MENFVLLHNASVSFLGSFVTADPLQAMNAIWQNISSRHEMNCWGQFLVTPANDITRAAAPALVQEERRLFFKRLWGKTWFIMGYSKNWAMKRQAAGVQPLRRKIFFVCVCVLTMLALASVDPHFTSTCLYDRKAPAKTSALYQDSFPDPS